MTEEVAAADASFHRCRISCGLSAQPQHQFPSSSHYGSPWKAWRLAGLVPLVARLTTFGERSESRYLDCHLVRLRIKRDKDLCYLPPSNQDPSLRQRQIRTSA